MTNYVKNPTWVDGTGGGTPVSAARLNNIEQGIYDAHFQPCARVYHNAAQSIGASAETTLAFNSERFDTDTIHDTATNNSRLTCKTAGKYMITAHVEWASGTADTLRTVIIRLNGTTQIGRVDMLPSVAAVVSQPLTTMWDLAVNDYIEVRVFQSTAGSLNVNSTASSSPEFMMARVG